jgi:lysophospholipase L1-like esterase
MVPKAGIKKLPGILIITVLFCCQACRQDTCFPEEIVRLGSGTSEESFIVKFPASASGSIELSVKSQRNASGTISFSGLSAQDSSVVVYRYSFSMPGPYYPEQMIPDSTQHLHLNWNLSNATLKVFLDSNLQTIRLAENDEPLTINEISIQNTSLRADSSELRLRFSGSDLTRDRLTENRIRIVAFGNSTTAYRRTITGVFAQRLPDRLSDAGIPNRIFNEGIPGSHTGYLSDNRRHNIPHGLDRFDESVLSRDPDVVIICFGLNDSWIDTGQEEPRIPEENYLLNLSYMVSELKYQKAFIILMTPNAIGSKYETWRYENSRRYAQIVRNLAIREDIPCIDQWRLFEEYSSVEGQEIDDLLLDGMHPNDAWHEKLSGLLSIIITEHIKHNQHE